MRLREKVALVTGAASGIGYAVADMLRNVVPKLVEDMLKDSQAAAWSNPL